MISGVILAAGVSSRLRPLTNHTPKSLLTVGGRTLLQRNLESLHAQEVGRCIIVTGYLHHMVEQHVQSLALPMEVEFIHNPAFEHTNNNYSLWLTREAMHQNDMLLLDADILYHPQLLQKLLAAPHSDALLMRRSDSLGKEEIKCLLDRDGAVLHIGKHLDPLQSAGESIGIEKFSSGTVAMLFDVLSRRHVHNEFYEASFQEVINNGARVFAVETADLPCTEIDTPDDLLHAEALAASLP